MTAMDRRRFLRTSAGAAAGLGLGGPLLAACSGSESAGPAATAGTRAAATATPGSGTLPGDLATLASRLQGRLVVAGQPDYPQAKQLYSPRFDDRAPLAIAYCASPADVQTSLRWAREHDVRLTARCGGHSYAGYSSDDGGLVIDVTSMAGTEVTGEATTVRAGTRLVDVYNGLFEQGVTIPAGSCPTVGVSGLTLGGGIGLIGRRWGLTSDRLREVELVTAAGDLVRASATDNPDLFWGCRGGGGGNLGIATAFVYDRVPAPPVVSWFEHTWAWADARRVLAAWQAFAPTAPRELFMIAKAQTAKVTPSPVGSPNVAVAGQWLGSPDGLRAAIAPFLAEAGPPANEQWGSGSYLDGVLFWAGCQGDSVAQCHLPGQTPDGNQPRLTYKAKSHYFDRPMDAGGLDAMIAAIDQRQADTGLSDGVLQLDSLGGAFDDIAADATAYVHRNASYHCQLLSYWTAGDPADTVAANFAWIDAAYRALAPSANGQAYQNYIDPDLADWPTAYYATNLPRLQAVKRAWDPDDVFRFAQSIPV